MPRRTRSGGAFSCLLPDQIRRVVHHVQAEISDVDLISLFLFEPFHMPASIDAFGFQAIVFPAEETQVAR